MISSTRLRSSTGGTNPAPMPWILCGPARPPDSTGDEAGSTATTRASRVALLQVAPGARQRAAGADAGDEAVDVLVIAVQISGPVAR